MIPIVGGRIQIGATLAIDYLSFAAKRWVVMVNHLNKNKNNFANVAAGLPCSTRVTNGAELFKREHLS
jgi:hypothetical protein